MEQKPEQLPTAPLIERFQGGIRANADPRMLAERLLRASELALEAARRDAADAMLACEELSERILTLELELAEAVQEPERLEGLLTAERRARRLAEQQAYSERAQREELQDELATERELDQTHPGLAELAEADERRRELETEVAALRRRADELAHLTSAARQGRERAERRVAELTVALDEALANPTVGDSARAAGGGVGLGPSRSAGLAREFAAAARPVPPSPPMAPGPPPSGADPLLALERRLVQARSEGAIASSPHADTDGGSPLDVLRAELATLGANAQRERSARLSVEARAARLEDELSEQIRRSSRAFDAIEQLRQRLGAIGGWSPEPPEPEPEPPDEAPGPAAEPASAPERAPEPSVAPTVMVEPERFNEALTRLREATPPGAERDAPGPPVEPDALAEPEPDALPEPAALPESAALPEAASGPAVAWLPGVFRRLARENPTSAGQLVLELLPAQREVHPEPIAYDLELPGQTCIQLTVTSEGLKLELGARRAPSEVRFAVAADPAGLARLLAAGRFARRLRRSLPKVTGDRRGLRALDDLLSAPLSLRQLHDAGVRFEPRLALELVARMIDPGWTRGSRFAIGYRGPGGAPVIHLEVADGQPVTVSDAPEPAVLAGTLTGESESLLARLDGREAGAGEFEGERARLAELVGWVKRAQSG